MAETPARRRPFTVAVVGRVPPPRGGVAASIASIVEACREIPGVDVRHVDWHRLPTCLLRRPNVVHFNFSHPSKRFLGTLLARLARCTIVHTIHGNEVAFSDFRNRLAFRWSDKIIVLNERVYAESKTHIDEGRLALMSPIVRRCAAPMARGSDPEIDALIARCHGRRIAVVYAYARDVRHGVETYGLLFVAQTLQRLAEHGYLVVVLDIKGAYSSDELDPHRVGNVIHVRTGVDFRALCRRVDVYVRPTATDGNSVAVLEALDEGTTVVASDVVPRPAGTLTYRFGDVDDFIAAMDRVPDRQHISAATRRDLFSTPHEYLSVVGFESARPRDPERVDPR